MALCRPLFNHGLILLENKAPFPSGNASLPAFRLQNIQPRQLHGLFRM
jgi:hypothetical protein